MGLQSRSARERTDARRGENLVDLAGIEPATSPARPGRAQPCVFDVSINS